MTKEDYLQKELKDYIDRMSNRRYRYYGDTVKLESSVAFSAGFNAACDYYRNNIMEIQDNGEKE